MLKRLGTIEIENITGGKEYCYDLGVVEICVTPNVKGTVIPPTASFGEWEIKTSDIDAVQYQYADQRSAEVAAIDRYNTDIRGQPALYNIGRYYYDK